MKQAAGRCGVDVERKHRQNGQDNTRVRNIQIEVAELVNSHTSWLRQRHPPGEALPQPILTPVEQDPSHHTVGVMETRALRRGSPARYNSLGHTPAKRTISYYNWLTAGKFGSRRSSFI